MSLSSIGSRSPVTAADAATALELARAMEEKNVGSVIVVRGGRPVGIVTDRDIVLRVVLRGLDPSTTRASEFMTKNLVTVADGLSIADAAARMRESGVRRLPVTADAGELVGVVSLDDLFFHVSRVEGDLADVICPVPIAETFG